MRVHQLVAAGARRVRAVLLHPLPHRHRTRRARRSSLRAAARSAAAAAAARRGGSREPTCRARPATCGRRATSPSGCCPVPSRPRRASSVHRHAAEVAAVDVGNAVVPRQPLVDERVVGRQQIEHAAVLAHDARRRTARSRAGSAWRRLSSKSGNSSSSARRAAGCAATATARRSCSTSASACGSASMRRTCCSSTAGSCSAPCAGQRRAARRPECCSRGRTTAARPARDR